MKLTYRTVNVFFIIIAAVWMIYSYTFARSLCYNMYCSSVAGPVSIGGCSCSKLNFLTVLLLLYIPSFIIFIVLGFFWYFKKRKKQ